MASVPVLQIYNRQRAHRLDLKWLRRLVKEALPDCQAAAKGDDAPLLSLEEVEFTIVSDAAIAKVHGDFLSDPTPTDVITFHHGEILVSADTALTQGAEHGLPLQEELGLYLIHGLLHLAGWDDHEAEEAAEMSRRQFAILEKVLGKIGKPAVVGK